MELEDDSASDSTNEELEALRERLHEQNVRAREVETQREHRRRAAEHTQTAVQEVLARLNQDVDPAPELREGPSKHDADPTRLHSDLEALQQQVRAKLDSQTPPRPSVTTCVDGAELPGASLPAGEPSATGRRGAWEAEKGARRQELRERIERERADLQALEEQRAALEAEKARVAINVQTLEESLEALMLRRCTLECRREHLLAEDPASSLPPPDSPTADTSGSSADPPPSTAEPAPPLSSELPAESLERFDQELMARIIVLADAVHGAEQLAVAEAAARCALMDAVRSAFDAAGAVARGVARQAAREASVQRHFDLLEAEQVAALATLQMEELHGRTSVAAALSCTPAISMPRHAGLAMPTDSSSCVEALEAAARTTVVQAEGDARCGLLLEFHAHVVRLVSLVSSRGAPRRAPAPSLSAGPSDSEASADDDHHSLLFAPPKAAPPRLPQHEVEELRKCASEGVSQLLKKQQLRIGELSREREEIRESLLEALQKEKYRCRRAKEKAKLWKQRAEALQNRPYSDDEEYFSCNEFDLDKFLARFPRASSDDEG